MDEFAVYLEIEKGTTEYQEFIDFANIDQGKIPMDLLENNRIKDFLPVFFRIARDTRPTEEELMGIIKTIQEVKE